MEFGDKTFIADLSKGRQIRHLQFPNITLRDTLPKIVVMRPIRLIPPFKGIHDLYASHFEA
jgi:hypothetical protein